MRGQSYAIPLCMMCKKRTICNLIPPPGRRTTTEKPAKTQNCCLCANFLLFCYLRLYKNVTINVKVLRICRKYCLGKWNCVTLHRSNQEFPGVLYCRKREIDAVGRSRARRCMPFIDYRNDTSLPWFGMSRISPFCRLGWEKRRTEYS